MPFGIHIFAREGSSLAASLRNEIKLARDYGIEITAAQIFAVGPDNYKETISPEDKKELAEFIEQSGVSLLIHGAYIDASWCCNNQFALNNIKREISIAMEVRAKGIVIHLIGNDKILLGLKQIDEWITIHCNMDLNCANVPRVYLEVSACAKNTYASASSLMKLFDSIKLAGMNSHERIGLCIDTAHVHAAGVDIRSNESMIRYLEGINAIKSCPEVIFHLNDQFYEMGAGHDKHSSLTYGTLWNEYKQDNDKSLPLVESGLNTLLAYASHHENIVVLERHNDKKDVCPGSEHSCISTDYITINKLGYYSYS